jgi:branched-chain amino acid aminotransferase
MSLDAGWPRRLALVAGAAVDVPPPPGARGMHEPLAGLPEGVYSGLRTFPGGRFLALEAHLDRAERSARALGYSIEGEREALVDALQRLADEAAPRDLALRCDVLAEPFALDGVSARTWIAAVPFEPVPGHLLRSGVGVGVARELARDRPLVKTTSFVLRRRPYPLGRPEAYEHLLLDGHGRVLEGSSSNAFVVRAGRLVTAGAGVLEGITRGLVLELARGLDIEVVLEAPALDGLASWQEAFLTSSTRAVLPIASVESEQVGSGCPGPLTTRLREAYLDHAARAARRARGAPGAGRTP